MKFQKTLSVLAVVCMTLLTCSIAVAGDVSGPIVRGENAHTLSRPLREYSPLVMPELGSRIAQPATITDLLNMAGQAAPKGQNYSDANGAVGATQYVQMVNDQYTIYDKNTGAVMAGPVAEKTLFSGLTGEPCATAAGGDGTVVYDQLANVWVLQHHVNTTTTTYDNCVAVSTSSDATGTYYVYDFTLTQQFPDKPKLGVWPDAYYMSQDVLTTTTRDFVRSQACALERSAMLAGTYALTVCFQGSISLPTFVVTTLDGQTPPNAGEVAFFWQLDQRPNAGRNNLNAFQFHVDWTTLANNTFTGPVAIALPAYTDACNNLKPCIPQPNTTNVLQGWGDRLMQRITYRNFGTYESVLMAHAVTQGTGTAAHASIRWYEFRTPLTPAIYQSSTYAPDKTTYRWVPSIAQDQFGEMALGYNVSSSTVNPGIAYAVRVPTDRLNTFEAEQTLVTGGGAQTTGNQNWPSFTSMTVDPVDDCTFYYTAQYYATSSEVGWKTQIASFRLPSCTN